MAVYVVVDCEARGTSPVHGTLTEFGAVVYPTKESFHGRLWEAAPDPDNPAIPLPVKRIATDHAVASEFSEWLGTIAGLDRVVLVSDNPAYDFMWIAGLFDRAHLPNPFGHSGRRISDFWAGLQGNWAQTQSWKRLRRTPHDHNPVHDALGNVEALESIMQQIKVKGT